LQPGAGIQIERQKIGWKLLKCLWCGSEFNLVLKLRRQIIHGK
jgi:hypothetical protein